MTFKSGDIVEIVRPPVVADAERHVYDTWAGFRARVSGEMDLPYVKMIMEVEKVHLTRLEPIGERPDAYEVPDMATQWFYWDTDELRLVEEV